MDDSPLPEPESADLEALLPNAGHRLLYGLLYRRREHPPTMGEIRLFLTTALGGDQAHFDRRLRELRTHFDIPAEVIEGEHRYPLRGWAAQRPVSEPAISRRVRAEVLSPQRCAQCGRQPLVHGIVLVVDHKVPRSWGGSNDVDNLQPLCEDCNAGKRDYFRTYEYAAEQIREAASHPEPQRRIGELLKAFEGKDVRTDLISVVASAREFQEDWQRRLRDLRFLGWDYRVRRTGQEGARIFTYYRLTHWEPWPPDIRAAINAEVERRKAAKKRGGEL